MLRLIDVCSSQNNTHLILWPYCMEKATKKRILFCFCNQHLAAEPVFLELLFCVTLSLSASCILMPDTTATLNQCDSFC